MAACSAARRRDVFRSRRTFRAASARSTKIEFTVWADCVEKLRISDAVIFRKEPVKFESQMRSAMRRIELAHERQKANWAEPLAAKSWSVCAGINFSDFAKNGVFQQYRLLFLFRCIVLFLFRCIVREGPVSVLGE